MNRTFKYISGIGIMTGLIYLFHSHPLKTDVKELKSSFMKSRQLSNRLIQQLKETKRDSVHLKIELQKMNLRPLKSHLNNFSNQLQPELKKLEATGQRMKNER